MTVEDTTDLEGFVADWDTAVFAGKTINGIFDNAYRATDDIGGSYPIFTCLFRDVSTAVKDSVITISDTDYKIVEIEKDNMGMVTLRLKTDL